MQLINFPVSPIINKRPTKKNGEGAVSASTHNEDFPSSPVVKNLPANAWDTGSIPGLRRSHML